ncbi:hypothetical protein Tco_0044525 [Tanacetum coccineum]
MPKITKEGYYTCNIHFEHEWKPPRCACCKVFVHLQEECPKNIGVGETKNLKKPSQTPKGVSVCQKVRFKPTKQVFQPVSKKSTANTSGNKKKNVEHTKEVSKSNPFDVLTSVENDVDSPSTTPIIEKIDKIKKLIIDGKVTLVDAKGKPLEKVVSSGNYGNEDEETDIQEKDKKEAEDKQNRARNGTDKVESKPKSVKVNRKANPDKVQSQPNKENTT